MLKMDTKKRRMRKKMKEKKKLILLYFCMSCSAVCLATIRWFL